jgi:LacI family transcriptional regulator
MALTLEDIANLSGVSRSTVSRVVNGDVNVREETRERVLAVIHEHDFYPNLAARRLATGKTGIIELIIPAGVDTLFAEPFFGHLIQGVSAACNAREYSVMLWLAEPEYERRMVGRVINSGLVDGVVVSSTLADDPIIASLHENKIPFISIGSHPTMDVNFLDLDNIGSGRVATQHLLDCGRKRIAAIMGPQNTMVGHDRYQGYRLALQQAGIEYDDRLMAFCDFSETCGFIAMKELLLAMPDGVFAASDTMAVGAIRAIKEAGLSVPEDISVIGHDDMPVALQVSPALTTMRQPVFRMGEMAVESLIDVIDNELCQPKRIILEPELVVRGSSRLRQTE